MRGGNVRLPAGVDAAFTWVSLKPASTAILSDASRLVNRDVEGVWTGVEAASAAVVGYA